MIRVHVAAEKSISSAMEDKILEKTGDNEMEERKVPDVKQKWRFELVEEV